MAAGDGLAGEARFIDAMAPRGAGVHAVRADPLLTRLAIVQVLAFMSAGATSGLPTAGSSTGAEVVVDSLMVLRMIWW